MNWRSILPGNRRTLALSLVAVAALAGVLIWALPRGSRAPAPAADVRASVPAAAPKASSPAGKPVAPSRATIKSRPPARMFAGSASAAGILIRVCEGGNCTALPQGNPATLEADKRSPLTFTLASRPAQAWLDVRSTSSNAVTRVKLKPGTLMAYGAPTAPGRYLLTLGAKFGEAETRWVFALKVA